MGKSGRIYSPTFALLAGVAASFFSSGTLSLAADKEVNEMIKSGGKALPIAQAAASFRPKVEYKTQGLRDPFRGPRKNKKSPVVEEQAVLPTLTVQGIVWGGVLPQAIINAKVVKVGDTVEGVRVIDITKDGVSVFFNGKQYTLSSPAAFDLGKNEQKQKGDQDEKEKPNFKIASPF